MSLPAAIKDMQPYIDAGTVAPALEFLSPIKGPALEQITVAVGSGINTGRGRRGAVRPGRGEAGPAAGPSRLVDLPAATSRLRMSQAGVGPPGPTPVVCRASGRSDEDDRAARSVRAAVAASAYPYWFYLPALVVFGVMFVLPTVLVVLLQPDALDALRHRVHRPRQLRAVPPRAVAANGVRNTLIYAVLTSGLKVVIGLLLATLLTSIDPSADAHALDHLLPGAGQHGRGGHHVRGAHAPVARADQYDPRRGGHRWAGLAHRPEHRAAVGRVRRHLEGRRHRARHLHRRASSRSPRSTTTPLAWRAAAWVHFRHVIVPLSRNATFTVILLSFIGGLRTFDLIWTMTRGGPGFTTDVITSTIYKQYQAGFYGLATAGNVILFIAVMLLVVPTHAVLRESGSSSCERGPVGATWWVDAVALAVVGIVFVVPFVFILFMAGKDQAEAALSSSRRRRMASCSRTSERSSDTRDGLIVTAMRNSLILTVASVDPDRPVRGTWWPSSCSAAGTGSARSSRALLLPGLIIPPAIVPTIFVLQWTGPVQVTRSA